MSLALRSGGRMRGDVFVIVALVGAVWLGARARDLAYDRRPPVPPSAVTRDSAAGEVDELPRAGGSTIRSGRITQVAMRNVDFYVDPEVVLHIREMRGTLRSRTGGAAVFDDKSSLLFGLAYAEVGLTPDDLAALMNKYVFAYDGAPLRGLKVHIDGAEIVQRGRMRKGLWFPFELRATVGATPEGHIRLSARRIEVMGLSVGRVLRAFGLELDELVDLKDANGVRAEGNDMVLDPELVLPPPAIDGRVTSVRLDGDQVVQVFGSREAADSLGSLAIPDRSANYMFYRGGTLRFGKLLMYDADMQIVDLDPADPFRFFLDRYLSQLVAGYSRTLPDGGLHVFMKDIDKVKSAAAAAPRP